MTDKYIFNSHTWTITSSSGETRKTSPVILSSQDTIKNVNELGKILFSISPKKVELLTKKEELCKSRRVDEVVWYDEVKDIFNIPHLNYRVYFNICLRSNTNINNRFHYTSKFATAMMRHYRLHHRSEKCHCQGGSSFDSCTYSLLKERVAGDLFLQWLVTYIPKDNARMMYEMMGIIHTATQDLNRSSSPSTPLTYVINWKQVTRSLTRCEVEIDQSFSRAARYLSSIRLVIPESSSYVSDGELRQLKYEVKDMTGLYPSHWKRYQHR